MKRRTKYTEEEIKSVVDALERVEMSLSDGYSYYTGLHYEIVMRQVARIILRAMDKVRGKKPSS